MDICPQRDVLSNTATKTISAQPQPQPQPHRHPSPHRNKKIAIAIPSAHLSSSSGCIAYTNRNWGLNTCPSPPHRSLSHGSARHPPFNSRCPADSSALLTLNQSPDLRVLHRPVQPLLDLRILRQRTLRQPRVPRVVGENRARVPNSDPLGLEQRVEHGPVSTHVVRIRRHKGVLACTTESHFSQTVGTVCRLLQKKVNIDPY